MDCNDHKEGPCDDLRNHYVSLPGVWLPVIGDGNINCYGDAYVSDFSVTEHGVYDALVNLLGFIQYGQQNEADGEYDLLTIEEYAEKQHAKRKIRK